MPTANCASPFSASDSTDSLVVLDEHEATGFSYWEFINQSDADSDTDSLHSVENGFLSLYSLTAPPRPRSPDPDEEIESEPVLEGRSVLAEACVEMIDDCDGENEEMDEYSEEEEIDDGYSVNDEVVAWNLKGKFGGRQRMRKLGKRLCSKMVNSKRDRYAYVKRGCVYGKREMEMKA